MTKAGTRMIASARNALAFARGENAPGFIVHVPDEIDTRRIRARLGLTQAQFCKQFGFELATLRDWEQGRRVPTGTARTLIRVIDKDASGVAAAIAEPAATPPRGTSQRAGVTMKKSHAPAGAVAKAATARGPARGARKVAKAKRA
jgi:putative transcriptional regulator